MAGFLLELLPQMQWFRRLSIVAHISLWIAVVAAFLSISVPNIFREASKNTIHLVGPFHSSDTLLYFPTHMTDASERLIALFDSLASSKPILIFVVGDDPRSCFLTMMIAYLAWPHPVRVIDVASSHPENLTASDRASVAAFVFCRVNRPPWLPCGERFGEAVEVVRVEKITER